MVKLKTVNWTSGLIKKLLILSLLITTILPNISLAAREGTPVTIPQTATTTVRPAVSPAPPSATNPYSKSSTYILGPSSKEYLLPYAGFGVNVIVDSCASYPKALADMSGIANLLKSQASIMTAEYFSQSCNKETTMSAACGVKLDSINNLLLSYATYRIESYKLLRNQSLTCNKTTNKPNGAYQDLWYGIDFVSVAYASVRNTYASKHTDSLSLMNALNSSILTNVNSALINKKFIDTGSITTPLRNYAKKSFYSTKDGSTSTLGSPIAPSLTTSFPFFIFGLTNNTTDRTIGAIPFNSIQEYLNYFNQDKTRFGDLYSAKNRSLIDAGEAVLIKSMQETDKRLPKEQPVSPQEIVEATTTPVAENVTSSQKASVINSIGNWFGGVWGAITNFFGWMFGVEKVEAALSASDVAPWLPPGQQVSTSTFAGSGAGWESEKFYRSICPNLPNPRPLPFLRSSPRLFPNVAEEVDFYELLVTSKDTKQVTAYGKYEQYGFPVLKDYEIRFWINYSYVSNNIDVLVPSGNSGAKEEPKISITEAISEIKRLPKTSLDIPKGARDIFDSRNDCLRFFATESHRYSLSDLYHAFRKITVTAIVGTQEQTATGIFSYEYDREYILSELYAKYENDANNVSLIFENRKNKK